MAARRFPPPWSIDELGRASPIAKLPDPLETRPKPPSWHPEALRELENMRTASLIMLSGLFVQVAHAAEDEIRHSTFSNVILGTWAETAQQCAAKDKSNVVIEPTTYGDGDGSCAVSSIIETEGSRGINYAVEPFAPARRFRKRPKPSISSCERLARIARRWDEFICTLPEAFSMI
jgi:hypothetical protein